MMRQLERPFRYHEPLRIIGQFLVRLRLWLVQLWVIGMIVLTLICVGLGITPRWHVISSLSSQAQVALAYYSPQAAQGPLGHLLGPDVYPIIVLTIELLIMACFTITAIVICWPRGNNLIALFFASVLITCGAYFTRFLDALQAASPFWQVPVHIIQAYGVIGSLLFFFTFPDGRFVPRWTQVVALAWTGINAAWLVYPKVPFNFSNPYTLGHPWFWFFLVGWVAGIIAQIYRYQRKTDDRLQRQTKWVVLSIVCGIISYGIYRFPLVLYPQLGQAGDPSNNLYNAISIPIYFCLLLGIPLCILMAIFYYRLWDVQIIANRTLVYATLTGMIAVVYVASVIALQILLSGLAGGAQVAIIGSTLAVAVLFQPLRHRIQKGVDRRFYRRKYNNFATLNAFTISLKEQEEMMQLYEKTHHVVIKTMHPASLSIWLSDDAPIEDPLSPEDRLSSPRG